jgi:pimeloyl-ACP methyl ester carboxylesterase
MTVVRIKWQQLSQALSGLATGEKHTIILKRETIPIVFVPGIMGSRLVNDRGDDVWNPDDSAFMASKFLLKGAAARRTRVIGARFSPTYLRVYRPSGNHGENKPADDDHGWKGVFLGSYSSMLTKLEEHPWPTAVRTRFDLPVHAFGYNWTASCSDAGKALADFIRALVNHYGSNTECRGVVLVTHSMGGLVARSACKRFGGEALVLGVVHGVQPALGAPAAYWRMKAGFERAESHISEDAAKAYVVERETSEGGFVSTATTIARGIKAAGSAAKESANETLAGRATVWTLGTNGAEVTALLGNMPGGLQLLPNRDFRAPDGGKEWLRIEGEDGATASGPSSFDDPYTTIYQERERFWRLIDPVLLNPTLETDEQVEDAWYEYVTCLDKAKGFHHGPGALGPYVHPRTWCFWGNYNGTRTAGEIRYTVSPLTWTRRAEESVKPYWYLNRGGFRIAEGELLATLHEPSEDGDGTVPLKSASGLRQSAATLSPATAVPRASKHPVFDAGHEPAYKHPSAQEYTLHAITHFIASKLVAR